MSYDKDARAFYGRLAAALPIPEDRLAYEAQLLAANVVLIDEGHDRFEFGCPPEESVAISEDVLDAIYSDQDGEDVNVIVHVVGGKLSWAERYRVLGTPIAMWPPPKDASLRFPKYDSFQT